jgi:sec-independent protein translocase protein TatC
VDEKKAVIEHIGELRSGLIRVFIVWGILSVLGFLLAPRIIGFISTSLAPGEFGVRLVVSHPMDFLMAEISIAILFGFVLSLPAIIYQAYAFTRPAFRRSERRLFAYAAVSGLLLFVLGMLFGYFVILKFTVWFLAGLSQPAGVLNLWNLNLFVSFAFLLVTAMGLVFILPVVTVALVRAGITDTGFLRENRPYAIIGIFILAAVISPPDPFSQVIVAVPVIVLYEMSIIVARLLR